MTHSMERALARMETFTTDGHQPAGALELSATHRALGDTLTTLLEQALQVREAPPVMRTFARTVKHLIPAMLEASANMPEEEVANVLRYVRKHVDNVLTEYDRGHPNGSAHPPARQP